MESEVVILVLSSLGIAQALFLCCYLFALKKGHTLAYRLLALVLLGLSLRIGKSILNVYMDLEPWQRNIGLGGILLVGPALWWYGKVLFTRRKAINRATFLHFAPYMLFTLCCAWIPNTADLLSYLIYIAVFGHLIVYLALSFRQLWAHQNIKQPKLYHWYRNLVIGVALIWIFYMGNLAGLIPYYIGGALFFTLLVYVFSFLMLRRHTFSLEKYQGSQLNQTSSKQLMDTMTELFSCRELFLEPQLSLKEVAAVLNTSPRKLSQAVNENQGMNFSEFVNSFRIERAKRLLLDPQNKKEKIATIAYDTGFNNVTSFNLAFKSSTQLTPSEFRKQHSP